MRLFNVLALMALLLFGTRLASAESIKEPQNLPVPILHAVNPESAKPGDVVTVSGENLDKSRVTELYLTNGGVDLKVVITDQSATAIKFKVPEKATAGRYTLTVLLAGENPTLLDEPLHLHVE
jgi:IPT/TIG domain